MVHGIALFCLFLLAMPDPPDLLEPKSSVNNVLVYAKWIIHQPRAWVVLAISAVINYT